MPSPAFVQKTNGSSDVTSNLMDVTFGSATTTHHQITGFITWYNPTTGATTNLTSVTDDGGSVYVIVDTISIGGSVYGASYYAKDCVSGSTVAAHFSDSNPGFLRMFAQEYSGGDTTSAINAHVVQFQASPGAGTNAISSGSAATSVDGCRIVGFTADGSSQTLPTVGTGFTSRDTLTSTDNDNETVEDTTQSSHGSIAATFTAGSGAGTDSYTTFMLAIAPPLTPPTATIAWVT